MLKKILIILSLIFCTEIFSACDRPYVGIMFNKDPITRETIANTTNSFTPDDRIYFLFVSEKPIVAKLARVQVYKYGDSGAGPTELVYAKDIKIHMQEYYYITDYFVIPRPGHYMMQIFARDQLYQALAYNDFYVAENVNEN